MEEQADGRLLPRRRPSLGKKDITVAELLKKAGYKTGITAKWGIAEPNTSGTPNKKGFDCWFGFLNNKRGQNYYPSYLWHNEEKVFLENNIKNKNSTYSQDLFTDFALDFIEENQNGPFFLYLPYNAPHRPFQVPDDDPYSDEPWPQDAKNYAAMITRIDEYVGRILDLLKELNIDENTIIFFTSDNGMGEGKFPEIFNEKGGPFRGGKRALYEGSIRVPMLVKWPHKISAGELNEEPWYFADFLPTACDLAGADIPSHVDGISILPALLGKEQDLKLKERYLYWELPQNAYELHQAVRKGDWKAVRSGLNQPLELYNLAEDESEQFDVSNEYPEVVQEIENYLQKARTDSEMFPVKR